MHRSIDRSLNRTLWILRHPFRRISYILCLITCDLRRRFPLQTSLIHVDSGNLSDAHASEEEIDGCQSNQSMLISLSFPILELTF